MSESAVQSTSGYIPFKGYKTWYEVHGDLGDRGSGKKPLLVLHGGPGVPHNYLRSLIDIAETGRAVIFYDQLGCGNSDRPDNPDLWEVELFVEELGLVREALGLDSVHLMGNSWGGMLAMEYLLTRPNGVLSATIEGSPPSLKLWVEEANRLRANLPPEVQETLLAHEAAGTTDSKEYQTVMLEFYRRHVCRLDPWPQDILDSFDKIGVQVYNTMNGPSEFHVVGKIKDWDITDRLPAIDAPTLFVSGLYDECTPMLAEIVHQAIPGNRWELFDQSAHVAHYEERDRFNALIESFMAENE